MSDSMKELYCGSQKGYDWVVSKKTLDDLLRLCPETVIGKYVAVTSLDSGPLQLSDDEKAAGWSVHGGIAYSPKIQSIEMLPHDQFDEWYVFASPVNIGELVPADNNIFESCVREGRVHVLVNYGGYALHLPKYVDLAQFFWEQIEWIKPESYIADGNWLNFVTSRKDLFATVRQALSTSD